jgi:hypothetical protein
MNEMLVAHYAEKFAEHDDMRDKRAVYVGITAALVGSADMAPEDVVAHLRALTHALQLSEVLAMGRQAIAATGSVRVTRRVI